MTEECGHGFWDIAFEVHSNDLEFTIVEMPLN